MASYGVVLDSEGSPRSSVWVVRKSLSITGAWESWEQSAHYWERLKKEKAHSSNKVPSRQAVARNGPTLASISQGKVEVMTSGLSISMKLASPLNTREEVAQYN